LNEIVKVDDELYEIVGKVSVDTNFSPDELKKQWKADTILRRDGILFITRKLLNAEFTEITDN